MARATHPPPSNDWPDLRVARAMGAPEAICSRAQQPARPGLIVGPARGPSVRTAAGRSLLPASILGSTDIKVKGTLTDTEHRQARIRPGLRRSQPCHGTPDELPDRSTVRAAR